jgi:hypothetical protein
MVHCAIQSTDAFFFHLQTQRNPQALSLHSMLRLSLKLLGHLINL